MTEVGAPDPCTDQYNAYLEGYAAQHGTTLGAVDFHDWWIDWDQRLLDDHLEQRVDEHRLQRRAAA